VSAKRDRDINSNTMKHVGFWLQKTPNVIHRMYYLLMQSPKIHALLESYSKKTGWAGFSRITGARVTLQIHDQD